MVGLEAIEKLISRRLAPTLRSTKLMILRGIVNLADDTTEIQKLQVDSISGNTPDEVEHLQPLGLTSVPMKDAECVVLSVSGSVDHPIVVGVQDRSYRPTGLSEGETKIYSAHGNTLYLNSAGECVLENSTGSKVTLGSGGNIDAAQSGSLVNLASASDFVAMATLVNTRCATIEVALNLFVAAYNLFLIEYNTHTHTSPDVSAGAGPPFVTVAPPDAAPSLNVGIPVVPTGSTAATNVKGS